MKIIKNLTAEELRKSILQLAIQGKLVKQDPNDEPASKLAERIYAEKQKLIKEGKIKKDKQDSYIFKGDDNCYYEKIGKEVKKIDDELPFDIPSNWIWIRQRNICWLDNGVISNNGSFPYLEAKVIRTKQPISYRSSGVFVNATEKIILVDGENSGEVMSSPFNGYMGSTFKFLRSVSEINFDYLLILFEIDREMYRNSKTGCAIPHLNKELFKSNLVALPPLKEQDRIVNRISEFTPLLNKYRINEFLLTNLENSFEGKLKASILQYAMEGKLVKQDPNDEPASELLKKIKLERDKLIKEGKIKKDKLTDIGYDKNYYEKITLPKGWINSYMKIVGSWKAGATPRRDNSSFFFGNIPWVKTGDLNDGIVTEIPEKISLKAQKESNLRLNPLGSILIAMYGATIGKLGILGVEATTNQACCACIVNSYFSSKFIFYYLMSKRKDLIKLGAGGAQPNISKEKILSFPITVPPKNEQIKIVEKLDSVLNCLK